MEFLAKGQTRTKTPKLTAENEHTVGELDRAVEDLRRAVDKDEVSGSSFIGKMKANSNHRSEEWRQFQNILRSENAARFHSQHCFF